MSKPLLSILIPFTKEREDDFNELFAEFSRQIDIYGLGDKVEILWDSTGKQMPIGEKRGILYNSANGVYSVQWDSDDWISEDGLLKIIERIKDGRYDGCGYKELCSINEVEKLSNISGFYSDWDGDGNSLFQDGFHFHRTLFFKTPIKTDLCRHVGVNKEMRYGEDHDFARRIKPLIKTHTYIDDFIYHYIHNSKPEDHATRYGLDRD